MKLILRSILLLSSVFWATAFATNIRFANQIDQKSVQLLQQDLAKLESLLLAPTSYDRQLIEVMGVETLDANTLRTWLADRVGYIVDENFDPLREFVFHSDYSSFPNASIFPQFDQDDVALPAGHGELLIVMANLGAAQYLIGKSKRQIFSFDFEDQNGSSVVPIVSPRQGVIKIGAGLFHPRLNFASDDLSREVNSIMRLATLFHEARHSDGNGTSLGFFHSKCPVGHPMQGRSACDKNLNGPYMIDALLIEKMAASCQSCTQDELTFLHSQAEESRSRVLTSYTVSDYTPEVKKQLEDLEASKQMYLSQWSNPNLSPRQEMMITNALDSIETRISRLLTNGELVETTFPTIFWDPAPEYTKQN